MEIGKPPTDPDQMVLFLAELASRAYNVNPNMPVPHRMGTDAEIVLLQLDGDRESDEEDSVLSFEDDAVQQLDVDTLLESQGEPAEEGKEAEVAQTTENS